MPGDDIEVIGPCFSEWLSTQSIIRTGTLPRRATSLGAGPFPGRCRRSSYTRCMTPRLADYIEAGYSLTPDERLQAARMLRLSVDQDTDSDPAEVESAWRDEIGSRVDDILAGKVELVDADETYRMLSAELASKRR